MSGGIFRPTYFHYYLRKAPAWFPAKEGTIAGTAINEVHHVAQSAAGVVKITGTAINAVHNVEQTASGFLLVQGSATCEVHHVEQQAEGDPVVLGTSVSAVHRAAQTAAGTVNNPPVVGTVLSAVKRVDSPLTTGLQTITDIGFTPKAVLVISQHTTDTTDETTGDNTAFNIGMSDGSMQWANSLYGDEGTLPLTRRYQADHRVIYSPNVTGGAAVGIQVSSIGGGAGPSAASNGSWTFDWIATPAGNTMPVTYIFFGGAGLSAFVNCISLAQGNNVISTGSVNPKLVFATSVSSPTSPMGGSGPIVGGQLSFGMAAKVGGMPEQVAQTWLIDDNVQGSTAYLIDDANFAGSISPEWRAAVTAFGTNSITVNVPQDPTADYLAILALDIGNAPVAVDKIAAPSSTSIAWFFFPGFEPQLGLTLFNLETEDDDQISNAADSEFFGIGVFDSSIASSEGAYSQEDAVAPHIIRGWHANKFIYFKDLAFSEVYDVPLPATNSSGWFVLPNSAVETAHYWGVLALGTTSAVVGNGSFDVHHIEQAAVGDVIILGDIDGEIHNVEQDSSGVVIIPGAAVNEVHHIFQLASGNVGQLISGASTSEIHHVEQSAAGISKITGSSISEIHHVEQDSTALFINTGTSISIVHHVNQTAAGQSLDTLVTGASVSFIHHVDQDALGLVVITGEMECDVHHCEMDTSGDCTPSDDTLFIYPLSSPQGRYIPTEVLGPLWYIKKSFTTSPMVQVLALPAFSFIMEVCSDQDCLISFCPTPITLPGDFIARPFTYLLRADQVRVIEIEDKNKFSVIGLTASGTLNMNITKKYAAISLQNMVFRG